jgi:hypothetical protein
MERVVLPTVVGIGFVKCGSDNKQIVWLRKSRPDNIHRIDCFGRQALISGGCPYRYVENAVGDFSPPYDPD